MSEKFNLKYNFNIGKTSWLGVGGRCEVLFKPKSLLELKEFLNINTKKLTILGNTSNVIISDDTIYGVVIKLAGDFNNILHVSNNQIEVGCGMIDKQLAFFAAEEEIAGLEFLSTIPGNLGGGIKMNCGCFGSEIAENLISLKGFDFKGKEVLFKANELKFDYRKCNIPEDIIITSAILKGTKSQKEKIITKMLDNQKTREINQPTGGKTLGSTFKNTANKKAWELLTEAGLQGLKIGGASFSSKHINFLLNDGSATAQDIKNLIDTAKSLVKEKCGVNLELEVKFI